MLLGGCGGDVLSLGALPGAATPTDPAPTPGTDPPSGTGGSTGVGTPSAIISAITAVPGLNSDASDDNPSLTGDMLEIYFASTREDDRVLGSQDIWFSTRASLDAPWSAPSPLEAVNSIAFETSPAVSEDGLTLWFGSEREDASAQGEIDVWVSARTDRASPWTAPVNVTELNTPSKDIPRPLGNSGLTMPMGSQRAFEGVYYTFLAHRPDVEAPFEAPQLIQELFDPPCEQGVNGCIADNAGRNTVDAFLSADGQTLFYKQVVLGGGEDDPGDLYWSTWDASLQRFSPAKPLEALNLDGSDERDLWLSPDGTTLFFASDRTGNFELYQATITYE